MISTDSGRFSRYRRFRDKPLDLILLDLPGIEQLPGPRWKLYNLRKMDPAKRRAAEELLRQKLGL